MEKNLDKNMQKYNATFEKVMKKIALMPFIEDYKKIKQVKSVLYTNFNTFSVILKKKENKKTQELYKQTCFELKDMDVLNSKLEGLLSALKVFSNEAEIPYGIVMKLSRMFKENFVSYKDCFIKFKKNFSVLKKLLNDETPEKNSTYNARIR